MGLPALGVAGAAVATAISQVVVALCFIIYLWIRIKRGDLPYLQKLQLKNFDFKAMKRIVSIGLPAAMQSAVLAILSMIVAKFVAVWGAFAIAAQRVGVQIESISWATCEGFAVAVSTFVGQNYGAKKYNRLKKGFLVSTGIVTLVGTVATLVLFLFNRQIYEFFVSDPVTISYGIDYMMILAISQIFMCIEISSAGAFNGVSKSGIAAFIIIIITALRVPFAWLVVQMGWSINGIWWIVSLTSIGKGLVLLICFMWYMRYRLKEQNA